MSRTVFWLALAALVAIPFQNCSNVGYGSKYGGLEKSGGEGFDGKTFRTYGRCNNEFQVADRIEVSQTQFNLTRQNCQELAAPQNIPINQIEFAQENTSVIAWQGKVFDEVVAPAIQPTTMFMCTSVGVNPEVQNLIWTQGVNTYGQISLASGANSGILSVLEPLPATPYTYVTANGQSSQFDLTVGNSLSYSLNGGATNSVSNLNCSMQPPPIHVVAKSSTALANVNATSMRGNITATGSGNLIAVALSVFVNSPTSCVVGISDNVGNTYVSANAYGRDPNSGSIDIWYALNSRPGATTVTVNYQAGCIGGTAMYVAEISGMATSSAVENVNVLDSQAATLTPAGAPITTTSARTVVFTAVSVQNFITGLNGASSVPFDALSAVYGDGAALYITSAPGTFRAVWNQDVTGTYGASTVVFKAAW